MPETQPKPVAASPSSSPGTGALFQVLTRRKADRGQVYTAIREIESMAGQGVVAELTALIRATAAELTALIRTTAAEQDAKLQAAMAEQDAKLQAAMAEQDVKRQAAVAGLSGRLDSVEKQLGRIWTCLFLILGTLLGTLTTLLTTVLLRG